MDVPVLVLLTPPVSSLSSEKIKPKSKYMGFGPVGLGHFVLISVLGYLSFLEKWWMF